MADTDMKSVNTALARLQSLDGRLMELDRQIGGIPGRRAAIEARLSEASGALEAAKGGAEADAATRRKLEREIEQIESERAKYLTQRASVKSNREFDALNAEIEQATERISAAEDRVLDLLERETENEGAIEHAGRALQAEESRSREDLGKLDAEQAAAEAERTETTGARNEAAAELGGKPLALYERIRRTRDGVAVVQLVNASCGGCYQAVPPQKVAETRSASKIVHCEYCGRILVKHEAAAS